MEKGVYMLLLIAASGYANATLDSFNNAITRFYESGGSEEISQEHAMSIEDDKFDCSVMGRSSGIQSICTVKNNSAFDNLQVNMTQDSLIFICDEHKYRFTFGANSSRKQICKNAFIVACNSTRITLSEAANPSNRLSWSATKDGLISNDSEMKRAGSDVEFYSGEKTLQVSMQKNRTRLTLSYAAKNSTSLPSESDMKAWYTILGINASFNANLHVLSILDAVEIKFEPLKPEKLALRKFNTENETAISAADSAITCIDGKGSDLSSEHVELNTTYSGEESFKLCTLTNGALNFTVKLYAEDIALIWESYTLRVSKSFATVEQSIGDRYAAIKMISKNDENTEYQETLNVERALSPFIYTSEEIKFDTAEDAPVLNPGTQENCGDSKSNHGVNSDAHTEQIQKLLDALMAWNSMLLAPSTNSDRSNRRHMKEVLQHYNLLFN